MNNKYFYQDKPLFGLDIGFSSVKVMQIVDGEKQKNISGYGVASFDPKAIKDGVIVDAEIIAKAVKELFDQHLIGHITTHRLVASIPATRSFARAMVLPKLNKKDLNDAVQLEAERYIPVPLDQLYIDYSVSKRAAEETDLLAVAVPKKIIDSYLALFSILGLEAAAIEPTISSSGRLFEFTDQSDVPTVLIDFGTLSADITIYDKSLIVTGTVPCGGEQFSSLIAEQLGVSKAEAHVIKVKYGLSLSKKQKEITAALKPVLSQLERELRRMIRYYEERFGGDHKISQIVTMGGGANMPGLSEYMTNQMRLPVRMCDPWQHLNFRKLQPPNSAEKAMYITVAGLALLNPKEIFG